MSNSTSPISGMPLEIMQHILSFDPLNPVYSRVNHQFRDAYTDLLRQKIRQIFEQCSTGQTTLNIFINSLRERCQNDDSHLDAAGVNKLHQLVVQKIQNFGIACPNRCLSPQEIHGYSANIAAVEDPNLQMAWDAIRQVITVNPLNLPAVNAPAAIIRTWMHANVVVLQHIHTLDLSHSHLTCIPEEIALLTGLQQLYLASNQIRELPVGIFNGLVRLQRLTLGYNQIRKLPVGIFDGLAKLQGLSLSCNQIRELPAGIFDGLVGLHYLNLRNNQIIKLPVGIFNGLIELRELSLDYNQIRELPIGIFNELIKLRELSLDGNPRLLVFYNKLRAKDFNPIKKIFNSFHQYSCRSAFARFYQFAAQGHALEEVIAAFHALDQTTKNAIYGMVYEEAGRPTTNDLQWGENHAFDDKGIFNGALKRYVRGRFNALSKSQKNAVYGHVYTLAREDQGSVHEDFRDSHWGQNHAEENVLRLIDAMIAASEASLIRRR